MSRLVKAVRSRHEINRTRRELNRAIANATTPAMRDELILVAQRWSQRLVKDLTNKALVRSRTRALSSSGLGHFPASFRGPRTAARRFGQDRSEPEVAIPRRVPDQRN